MNLYYFGYGANRDPQIIKALTGRSIVGRPGHIEGFKLCVQKLKNLPTIPKKILRKVWGKDFESYAIIRARGKVYGMLYKINKEDRKIISDWELISEGWFKDIEVKVILKNGDKIIARTEIIENQKVDRVIDGSNYKTHLSDPKKKIEHAHKIFWNSK